MGNEESKIYKITVKLILYEKEYIQPKSDIYYYIEKSWYDQFCKYIRKERTEEYITRKLSTEEFNEVEDIILKMPKDYSLNQDNIPPNEYNLEVHNIALINIEDNQVYQILDVSKYIKINEEFQNALNKIYYCKYKIKCNNNIHRFRLIFYDEKQKQIDEKYIKGEKEMVDIKLLEIYNNLNPIIIFSKQKEEMENFKKEYENTNLKEKIESLEYYEFYL